MMRTGAVDIGLAEPAAPNARAGAPVAPMQPEPTLLWLVDRLAEIVVVTALLGELVLVLANVAARVYFAHSFLWTDEIARLAAQWPIGGGITPLSA
jgi:hypothetical protein